MSGPPSPTPSSTLTTSTPSPLLFQYENGVVSVIVGFLLIALVVSYLVLCCHVLRLHRYITNIFRRDDSSSNTTGNGVGRYIRRLSISLPMRVIDNDGRVIDDGGNGYNTTPIIRTPPPRYSVAVDSLPSYSCVLRRMVSLTREPLQCRITVMEANCPELLRCGSPEVFLQSSAFNNNNNNDNNDDFNNTSQTSNNLYEQVVGDSRSNESPHLVAGEGTATTTTTTTSQPSVNSSRR
ncbi:hypothetical protein Pmani_019070 [Petrolisthes manimaculis]|uniref:Uncharacterized protein n=1 Tax=Petrolisthes manimaculis TaxID=1843537 RepID=A0AAE1PKB8_9EUCA|nr:hypothetical protein Pmani_019070 [Petrolisthes manimaculis]